MRLSRSFCVDLKTCATQTASATFRETLLASIDASDRIVKRTGESIRPYSTWRTALLHSRQEKNGKESKESANANSIGAATPEPPERVPQRGEQDDDRDHPRATRSGTSSPSWHARRSARVAARETARETTVAIGEGTRSGTSPRPAAAVRGESQDGQRRRRAGRRGDEGGATRGCAGSRLWFARRLHLQIRFGGD